MKTCSLYHFAQRGHDLVFVLTNLSFTEMGFTTDFLLCLQLENYSSLRSVLERSMINQMHVIILHCYLSWGVRGKMLCLLWHSA